MAGSKTAAVAQAPSLFGKTRQTLLALLYSRADEEHLQESLIQLAGLGRGAVQRELEFLARAGVVRRTVRGRQVYFQANAESPIYGELRGLVVKTAGVGDALRGALAPLAGRIRVAFVYGSFAKGTEGRASDVDVMVIGDASFAEVSDALGKAQQAIGREVNPSVYGPADFRAKLAARQHFLRTVLEGEKVFLIGDEHELGRLAKK
ncbi:MAG TPA: nucleotidyltransferase domain-containing protein [Burkholderiales bacterium]|nr:nucleotidyltransferase domain-containing protein [Burkholderiales bacterium]